MEDFGELRQTAAKTESARKRTQRWTTLLSTAFLGFTMLALVVGLTLATAAYGPRVGLQLPLDQMGLLGEIAATLAPPSEGLNGSSSAGSSEAKATIRLPSPIPTATLISTATDTPTATRTFTPTPSSTSTVTATPSRTLTPSPTLPPSMTPSGAPPTTSTFTATTPPTATPFPDCSPSGNPSFESGLSLYNRSRGHPVMPVAVGGCSMPLSAQTTQILADLSCGDRSAGERVVGPARQKQ